MKNLKFLSCMLLSLVIFNACSNDDESEKTFSNDVAFLNPIDEGLIIVPFSDFFKKSFDMGGNLPFSFRKSISNEKKSPCIILNSKKDVEEAYTGDLNIPDMDFSNYTLIIGKIPVSAGTFINDMVKRKSFTNKATLAISCVIDGKGAYITAMVDAYYWKLFPKFHASKIKVEVSQNIGEVNDTIKNHFRYV